jgi:hypothetical protein
LLYAGQHLYFYLCITLCFPQIPQSAHYHHQAYYVTLTY